MSKANTVCVDFDWTLCSDDQFGEPNESIVNKIGELYMKRYSIIIYTSRSKTHKMRMYSWLFKHHLFDQIDEIVFDKPEAVAYIDDRAIAYTGKRERPKDSTGTIDYIEQESKILLTKWVKK